MAIIRKVFGPFHPEHHNEGMPFKERLVWHFFGIREDGDTSHWVLSYDPKTRKFLASNTGNSSIPGPRYRAGLRKEGIKAEAGPCLHPKMFIESDTSLTEDDTITNILRRRLTQHDIANATALSIKRR